MLSIDVTGLGAVGTTLPYTPSAPRTSPSDFPSADRGGKHAELSIDFTGIACFLGVRPSMGAAPSTSPSDFPRLERGGEQALLSIDDIDVTGARKDVGVVRMALRAAKASVAVMRASM